MYVCGKEFDRFGPAGRITMEIDPDLIKAVIAFSSQPKEIQDQYLDRIDGDESISDNLRTVIDGLLTQFDDEGEIAKAKKGESFYMMMEEYGFGFGHTKEEARLVLLEGEDANGC